MSRRDPFSEDILSITVTNVTKPLSLICFDSQHLRFGSKRWDHVNENLVMLDHGWPLKYHVSSLLWYRDTKRKLMLD